MVAITTQTAQYITSIEPGTVFSFGSVVTYLKTSKKDTVNHALKKLTHEQKIVHIKRGLYMIPQKSRFGEIPAGPSQIAKATAENIGAKIYPGGAAALHALGLSTQVPMGYSYISSKRIAPFIMNAVKVQFRYSRALARVDEIESTIAPKEKELIMLIWLALEYLGEKSISEYESKLEKIIKTLSNPAKKVLNQAFGRKLLWAKVQFNHLLQS